MRVFGIALIVGLAASAMASCQPLYGGKPAALKNPPKKKAPPEAQIAAVAIPWDDECQADFHGKPGSIPPNPAVAKGLVESGNNVLINSERTINEPQKRAAMTLEAIEKFKAALAKDPYSAEATYGLAVAYAKVLKKGCALKLLKRLADLKGNQKYASDAQRMIDAAADTSAFKPFKKDAAAAMGI